MNTAWSEFEMGQETVPFAVSQSELLILTAEQQVEQSAKKIYAIQAIDRSMRWLLWPQGVGRWVGLNGINYGVLSSWL